MSGCTNSPSVEEKTTVLPSPGAVLSRTRAKRLAIDVVLVVGPFFKRMVVAAGAVDRHAEKGHRSGLRHLKRILVQHEEVRCPVLQRAPFGRHDASRKLIPRSVRLDLIANPGIIGPHRRRTQPFAVDQEQVGPLIGPVVDELAAG